MQSAQPFIDTVCARSRELESALPLITRERRASCAELARTGVPSGKLETWKYTPIRDFYAPPFGVNAPTTAQSGDTVEFFSFGDAVPILIRGSRPILGGVPTIRGAHVTTLRDPARTAAHLPLNADLDAIRHPLSHLNLALLEDVLVIRVDPGVDAGLVDLRFMSGIDGANVSRVSIELGAGSVLRLIEQRAEDRPTNSVVQITIGERARLEHTRVSPRGTPFCWNLVSARVGDGAVYDVAGYALGSSARRNDIHVKLHGAHARTQIDLACGAYQRDRLDHQIVVEHIGTDTVSRQVVHGIAAGSSELSLNGRIHIHPGAQRSDARLTNKNLLLDRKARVNSKPELEIYANDVKCSHGATVGQLDPAQTFYLRARGLDERAARALLMRAFLSSRLTPLARDAGVEAIFAELFNE